MTDTIVTLLLDESGSMASIADDTIGGFNSYVKTLKETGKNIEFTLIKFDTEEPYNVVFKGKRIEDVPLLDNHAYKPRGGTPLVDSAYRTIAAIENDLAAMKRRDITPKVLVVIQTDGAENSSREHTTQQLKVLVEKKQGQGWEFVFMGAGIDAYSQASQFGIKHDHISSYSRAMGQTAFANLATNTASWMGSGSSESLNYTRSQKMAQGDAFDPDLKTTK